MKVKIIKNNDEHLITIPKEVIEMLGWEIGDELKMEVARDFDLNPTTLVVTR